jgi:hypothetical protein
LVGALLNENNVKEFIKRTKIKFTKQNMVIQVIKQKIIKNIKN